MSKIANKNTLSFLQLSQKIDNDTENLFGSLGTSFTNEEKPQTVAHAIANSKLPPAEKALPCILTEVHVIVGAGLETASSVMRLMVYHVFSNTEIKQEVREQRSCSARNSD
ncbi:uncharacterized protein F4812DRAFT_262236 [Daldinia caldariorum]|uniref:uncharacterized protein n=1 Tax=Daldinia caldariorum TaxID=326644 RepID=UPI002008CADB|nr:uncharacterized protein F4812DRAFT_262236 [Daldinia caldariorum]KAI1470344.1 hypothetical protein F4812DRAFT_262236 [Daldinia caldariorum]